MVEVDSEANAGEGSDAGEEEGEAGMVAHAGRHPAGDRRRGTMAEGQGQGLRGGAWWRGCIMVIRQRSGGSRAGASGAGAMAGGRDILGRREELRRRVAAGVSRAARSSRRRRLEEEGVMVEKRGIERE